MSGIVAILPAFNEEVSIGSMVLLAKQHADRVIVVDDGSHDRTAEVATLAGAEVIRHPENRGKGAALKTGFSAVNGAEAIRHPENRGKGAALKTGFSAVNGAEAIVTLDTDGQHNPAEIPKVAAPILAGEADIVNGSRYLNGEDRNTPLYRRVGQKVLDTASNLGSGANLTDTQSGFRAFAPSTIPVFRFRQTGLAIESEMLSDAGQAGLRIKEVEIGVRYDVDCSTEHPVSHGLRVLVKILHDMELRRPLYYFTLPGLILAAVGVGMGLLFLKDFYHGAPLHFGPTLMMIMLTLVGSFLAMTGVILHSISRLINESKVDRVLRTEVGG